MDRFFGQPEKPADQEKVATQRAEVIAFFETTPLEILYQNIMNFSDMLAQGVDKEFLKAFLEEIAPSKLGKSLVLLGTLRELDHRSTEDASWALSSWKELSDYMERPLTQTVDLYAGVLAHNEHDSFEHFMSEFDSTRETLGQQSQSE
ncbi:MAG: hypothetical protein ACD_51C00252G0003 [uncultured bacterium]|uniref:Uncharacterized protein n=2 Tax=Candidatus Chisholmiibacteriota TaxID=1817900 RepID=A0A1G1VMC7_9BACT|nr:MAG: hypothetical protein ACD_51C00252G0003 [uncultured bacterium]OGY16549.1 MAG: hypothetical protein A2785_03080 [Candidatus Chisholmbacteria bacterium RIFCSPHIGHO2_01_FULL_49_18]OGY20992.1 MAG: hypothetical protein A3A65_01620 [Candidatus Chisholmbacteria bacterium RIFCSPLOWO2_01_FULL_49_14]HKZ40633.1 hypothetical protein [Candidatus Hodarchaeales archaeon]